MVHGLLLGQQSSQANFHAPSRSAPLMMKETTGVLSRRAEVVKTFDGVRPRKLTRPATIHSYPRLHGTA